MTLTEFLLTRIAEDGAAARAVKPLGHNYDMGGNRQDERFTFGRMGYASEDGMPRRLPDGGEAVHFARHNPVRVLAECEAKRRIVEWHESWPVMVETPPEFVPADGFDMQSMTFQMSQKIAWLTTQEYRARFGDEPPSSPMLRAIAAVYADHPDYREEWRP